MVTEEQINELKEQIAATQVLLVESLQKVSENEEIFKYAARCYRRLFENLINEGFSIDQSIEILKNYSPMK